MAKSNAIARRSYRGIEDSKNKNGENTINY